MVAGRTARIGGVSLGKAGLVIHVDAFESEITADRRGDQREKLSEPEMVDIFSVFRKRPSKRGPPGFARSREDITSLTGRIGNMLSTPLRDAPPIARETVLDAPP